MMNARIPRPCTVKPNDFKTQWSSDKHLCRRVMVAPFGSASASVSKTSLSGMVMSAFVTFASAICIPSHIGVQVDIACAARGGGQWPHIVHIMYESLSLRLEGRL